MQEAQKLAARCIKRSGALQGYGQMSRYGYGEGGGGGRYNGLQSVGSAPTRPFDRYGSSGGMQVRLVYPLE